VFNDAIEIKAFGRFAPGLPFFSVKGAIGHCLGAAGVIEAAVSLASIEAGVAPPTVGLADPDAGAETALTAPAPLARPAVISCNSGFGGINAAALFRRQQAGDR
jgi:3-oxoacyl-(acyl-carrier-protein) synthase